MWPYPASLLCGQTSCPRGLLVYRPSHAVNSHGLGLSEPNAFHAFIFLWSKKCQGNCCWINVAAVPLHANSNVFLLPARSGNKRDQFSKRTAHPPQYQPGQIKRDF